LAPSERLQERREIAGGVGLALPRSVILLKANPKASGSARTLAGICSFYSSRVMGYWPEAFGDDFGDVKDFEVIALGMVGGVAKHDGTVGASHHHRGGVGFGELGESKFAHPLFRLVALVVSDKKLRAAGSTALRVLAMARRFRERDAAGAKDIARRRSDAPAPG